MYNKRDYDRFEFIKKKLFIITNLDSTRLHNKTSKYEDRSITIVSAVTGVFILIWVMFANALTALTGFGPIGVLILLMVIDAVLSYLIILHVQYKINDRIRERSLSEDGNVKFDLSKVWRISPGGIQENIQLVNDTTVGVRYTTNAIIMRGIMRGVVDCESNADKLHYDALQRLVDMAMRGGFELNVINLPYDIDNDPIWESESEKIYRTSAELGNDYTVLMNTLHNHIYDFTEKNHRITVTYYILKSAPGTTTQLEVIAQEIQKLNMYCQMSFTGISMKEFKNLLEGYYGINVSIEDITNFMTITSTDLGECKIISYVDSDHRLIQSNKIFDYSLPEVFTTIIPFSDVDPITGLSTNEDNYDATYDSGAIDSSTIFDRDII